ncbi:DNA-processing protein DprA [Patescibacteria group bacterium]|nr:DNA-processing protein DprA [Patescibacteria group bacterium]
MIDQIYWNSFNCILQTGPQTFKKLIDGFSSMQEAWEASYQDLTACGVLPTIAQKIVEQRIKIDPEKEWVKLERAGIKMITIQHKQYPLLLNEIARPPAVLYWKGDWQALATITIAIVGTRKPTAYGREIASDLAGRLAQEKICIASGMALGIDGVVHKAALENNGKTVAVLGSGIDILYPRTHERLAREIIEKGGIIISEFPHGTAPLKYHFPIRNRIISGISVGCVVVEAGKQSGALITARFALEQNREVFAVPGSIYQKSSIGPNNLIKMGAKVVTGPEDILETLHLSAKIVSQKENTIEADNPEEAKIIAIISLEPTHIDDIVTQSGLSATVTNSTLTLMEMKGKVKNIGGMNYTLSR